MRNPARPDLAVEVFQPLRFAGTSPWIPGNLSHQIKTLDIKLLIMLAEPGEIFLRLAQYEYLPAHATSENTSAADLPRVTRPAS